MELIKKMSFLKVIFTKLKYVIRIGYQNAVGTIVMNGEIRGKEWLGWFLFLKKATFALLKFNSMSKRRRSYWSLFELIPRQCVQSYSL